VLAVVFPACTGSGDADGGGGSENGVGASGSATSSDVSGGNGTSAASGTTSSTGSSGSAGGLGPEYCPAPDPGITEGFDIGERLAGVTVKDCSGNDVGLDAFCGAKALWIFAAHGWCPLCQSVSGKQEDILADYAAQGLVAINVVVENGQSQPPDAAYCELWRDNHGLAQVYTLYDPTGDILALWPGGSSSLSAFVDRDRIIVSKLVYSANDEAAIRQQIEAALAE
jgi:hypothetical protein